MSAEEQAKLDEALAPSPEMQAYLDRKAAFDEAHPRCYECGQFLKKNPDYKGDETPWAPKWISHFYRSSYEYNEWDHI